jgi:UDP-N-acetylglucosamine 3-dehydrogenase
MADIGVGIIGAGYMGRTHASHYAALPGVRIVGVSDLDDQAAAALAGTLGPGVGVFTDIEDLLAVPGIDAVSVCTPDAAHRLPVEAAAAAGVHVLLEKPIATTLSDARAILSATESAQVTLAMGFVSRYLDTYSAAHAALDSGTVGAISTIGVRRFNAQYAGAKYCHRDDVIDFLAVHDVDILRWFGGEITAVTAMADAFVFTDSPHMDTAQMLLRFASGAIGHLHVTWAYPDSDPPRKGRSGIDVVGTTGAISMDSLDDRVLVDRTGAARHPMDWNLAGAFRDQIATFVASVRGEARPRATGIDGLRALEVILAAKQSLADGGACVAVSSGKE